MRFGSACSGIEAASVAWLPLGWECAWVSEIDPFCCALLAHHYPDVPNLGDMLDLDPEQCADIDVLIAGPPCVSFSVAGLRGGLSDDRGNLSLHFVRLANAIDDVRQARGQPPVTVVYENVPGLLSERGNAFGHILALMSGESDLLEPPGGKWTNAGCVLGPRRRVAWRILDAQFFGVPQRRRRVFVIASAGDVDPGEILFEPGGVRGDTAAGKEKKTDVAGTIEAGVARSRGAGTPVATLVAGCLESRAATGGPDRGAHGAASGHLIPSHRVAMPLRAKGNDCHDESHQTYVAHFQVGIRRLTPAECSALQGLPRDYTAIPYRGKSAADGPRYRAIGNSMAVPVIRWIGERIEEKCFKSQ